MSVKKVLILGSKGMLGQELISVFKKDKKYEVVGWDKEDLDIADEKDVKAKVKKTEPDIIINSAAYNAVDKAEEKSEYALAKKINGDAPGHIAETAKKIGAVVVHYSTDYVFSGDKEINFEPAGCNHVCQTCALHDNFMPEIGYTEDDLPDPISNYGKSKLLGEKKVLNSRAKVYVIRLSKLFGQPGISEGAKRSFFDVMLELGRKNKEVKVVDEEISCFTYAPDLAQKTKEIIENKLPFGVYHVVNEGPCTWYEAVLELYKLAGIKTKVIPVDSSAFPRPAKRPKMSVLINKKMEPMRSYVSALKDYLKIK